MLSPACVLPAVYLGAEGWGPDFHLLLLSQCPTLPYRAPLQLWNRQRLAALVLEGPGSSNVSNCSTQSSPEPSSPLFSRGSGFLSAVLKHLDQKQSAGGEGLTWLTSLCYRPSLRRSRGRNSKQPVPAYAKSRSEKDESILTTHFCSDCFFHSQAVQGPA